MRLIYLSEGRLFRHEPGRAPTEIESPFAREHVERAEERKTRHAWKNAEAEGNGPFNARTVWGRQADVQGSLRPAFRFVTRGTRPGEILYVLGMTNSAGVFRQNLDTGEETRLFHRQDFLACGLCCDPRTGRIIVSVRGPDGLAKLQLIDEDERRRDTITTGEGHDSLPACDPRSVRVVCFQSAGAGRDENGDLVELGPTAIHTLNYENGAMTTLLEDAQVDHLSPRLTTDGTLYTIRRPYRAEQRLSAWEQFKAVVVMPAKLIRAAFGFLDLFTKLFARESLRPAGGPDVRPAKPRFATFFDHPVDLKRVLATGSRGKESVKLVPATWELVRRAPTGHEEVVATHIVAYDLGPAGELVYTDGLRLWRGDGTRLPLQGDAIIQSVLVI